jgi:hypothetical protein
MFYTFSFEKKRILDGEPLSKFLDNRVRVITLMHIETVIAGRPGSFILKSLGGLQMRKTVPHVRTTVSLAHDVHDRLRAHAFATEQTINDVISRAVETELRRPVAKRRVRQFPSQ